MNKPLFHIVFVDGSTFNGGDYQNTKWLEIPQDKKIRTLFYLLPTGDYLGIGGYEKLYHFVECTEDLNGDKAGVKNLESAYIIGQRKDYSIIYRIDLKTGSINAKQVNNDVDFLRKLNPIGWR